MCQTFDEIRSKLQKRNRPNQQGRRVAEDTAVCFCAVHKKRAMPVNHTTWTSFWTFLTSCASHNTTSHLLFIFTSTMSMTMSQQNISCSAESVHPRRSHEKTAWVVRTWNRWALKEQHWKTGQKSMCPVRLNAWRGSAAVHEIGSPWTLALSLASLSCFCPRKEVNTAMCVCDFASGC